MQPAPYPKRFSCKRFYSDSYNIACTVREEVFPPDTPTVAISDVLHTTEPTEIGTAAEIELSAKPTAPPQEPTSSPVKESGEYSSRDEVALYIHLFGHLPANFITKKQARELGWQGGGLQDFAPGCSIGGDRFGNYEGLLPQAEGRFYTECDIDTCGAPSRGAKRIVFSNDGLIFYTDDHYQSFIKLYDADNQTAGF